MKEFLYIIRAKDENQEITYVKKTKIKRELNVMRTSFTGNRNKAMTFHKKEAEEMVSLIKNTPKSGLTRIQKKPVKQAPLVDFTPASISFSKLMTMATGKNYGEKCNKCGVPSCFEDFALVSNSIEILCPSCFCES